MAVRGCGGGWLLGARAITPGGYGGGGGGGYNGGGGGGGAPGGGEDRGGYSYVIKTALDPFGITGGNPGAAGYVSIEFVAVPEFVDLGHDAGRLQRARRHDPSARKEADHADLTEDNRQAIPGSLIRNK